MPTMGAGGTGPPPGPQVRPRPAPCHLRLSACAESQLPGPTAARTRPGQLGPGLTDSELIT